MELTEAIELASSLIEKVGVTEEVENLTLGINSLGGYLSTVEQTINDLQTQLEEANSKSMSLRKANNDLFRQLNMEEVKRKKAIEELAPDNDFASLF